MSMRYYVEAMASTSHSILSGIHRVDDRYSNLQRYASEDCYAGDQLSGCGELHVIHYHIV